MSYCVGFNPINAVSLRARLRSAEPFPFVQIEDFLNNDFARAVADAFPGFEQALGIGRSFSTVNEQRKVQITDASKFPRPSLELHELLASSDWLETLTGITGIADLIADPELIGGGIHETGAGGRLDVHVDFNYLAERSLHRRLNILLYFNSDWREEWGGNLELWDRDVRTCIRSIAPVLNRCVIFELSPTSFHGVTPITCPPGVARKSFAAYYYTGEAPPGWDGRQRSTVFRARPSERFKGRVLMPAERAGRELRLGLDRIKRLVKIRLG
jgi:Rps23 Pro-64 3,4-dihydroxylase Tpa1-like proline 4-hydroxylase